MTIHAGLTRMAVDRLRHNPRLTHVVSRGGSLLVLCYVTPDEHLRLPDQDGMKEGIIAAPA